jgi:hypothetical protein
MITPYLSMSLPDVLITAGSTYASQINQAFLVLDTLVGQGTTPSQININADLSFQNNSAVNVRAVRFTSTGTLAAPADIGVLYNNNGNLYFNNNSGQPVQVTSGSAIVAANGNIGGLTGTSASVTFSPVTNAFTFNSSPGNLAILSASTLTLSTLSLSGALSAAIAWLPNVSMLSASTAFFGTVTQMTASNARIASASFVGASVLTASQAYLPSVSFISASVLSASNAYIANAFFSASNLPNATLVNTATLTASNALITNGTITTATITSANITRLTASGELVSTNLTASSGISTSYATIGTSNVIINPSNAGVMISASGDIVARGGFKQQVGPAVYYNTSNVIAGTYNLNVATTPSANGLQFQWVAPVSGSLLSIQVAYVLPSAITYTLLVNKNAAETAFASYVLASPTNLVGNVQSYAKDALTFAPGDLLNMQVQTSATGFLGVHAWLTVEC